MNHADKRFWTLAAATVAVLGLAYGPLLVEFFANQWERPHYQYFPFVLGAFVWLLWQRCLQAERVVSGVGQEAGGEDRGAKSEERGAGGEESMRPRPRPVVADDGQSAANRYDVVVAMVVAWALLGLAYLASSPWLAYLSAIGLVTSVFLRVASGWRVPYLWGVWLLPWLALPLPLNRDQQLVSFLQRLSSRLSSFMLDWVGVIHLMDGNTLLLGEKQFFVDEACSGIISVMSIIACAVIYGVWRNRPPLHLVVLAAAGVGWATLMNVARISVIALVYQWYGVDWSKGTPHEILGLVIFLLTFLALVSTDYVLLVLLTPIGVDYVKQYGQRIRHGAWLVAAWDWLLSRGRPALAAWPSGAWPPEEYPAGGGANPASSVERRERQESGEEPPRGYLAKGEGNSRALAARFVLGVVPLAAFGALAAAQLAIPHAQRDPSRMPHNLERALALVATSLPTELSSAKQTKFTAEERARDDVFGNFSRIYQYQDRYGNIYLVSCDFPLEAGGHELTVCYEGIGWQMVRREVRPDPEKSQNPLTTWGYAEADFTMPDGSAAALAFCSFDEYGTRVTPPSYSLWDDFWRSLQRQSWANRSERTFQVQVWTTAAGTVHEEQKQLARDLLLGVRNRFRELVTGEVDRGEN